MKPAGLENIGILIDYAQKISQDIDWSSLIEYIDPFPINTVQMLTHR